MHLVRIDHLPGVQPATEPLAFFKIQEFKIQELRQTNRVRPRR